MSTRNEGKSTASPPPNRCAVGEHPRRDPVEELTYLEIAEARLRFPRVLLPSETPKLRGYLGTAFSEAELLHNHNAAGGLRYDYPRVQLKVVAEEALLVGIGEGVPIVVDVWSRCDVARLGDELLPILEATLNRRRAAIGALEQPLRYTFRSPWLGLNQDNHFAYACTTNEEVREQLLRRVLIGNCLSLAKSFGHRVATRLAADCRALHALPCRLKGVSMLGFRGSFSLNFSIPDRLGIGKSVSRGFGIVERWNGDY
ncbi:MAG: hypothetical protein HYV63_10745 [Candidatus Schekmanbacteria bacterium]|nr:hypothetical protein [Candidatus Schekmanbacteria bacterium]